MNWKKVHDDIIERAKDRCLEGYSEMHHIIPKCLGGSDLPDNLVRLTAREHFIIHKLLCEIYPNESKLHWAAFMMAQCKGKHMNGRDYRIGSREYAWLRENLVVSDETKKKISEAKKGTQPRLGVKLSDETKLKISESRMGQPSPRKGVKLTEATKKKLRTAAKNRDCKPHSEETKRKISEAWSEKRKDGYVSPMKGVPRTDEIKQKISASKTGVKRGKFSQEWLDNLSKSLKGKAKGKIWITNGINNTMIHEKDGIPSGWHKGLTRKNKK